MNIRNRIIEQRLVTPDEVAPNPRNWRTHPQAQRDALRGILGQVGIAAPVIAYYSERAGNRLMLIDGHERMTVGVPFPCAILDVDDAEADTLLATFDPITAMATANNEALDALLRDVTTDSPALTQMLAELAEDAGLYVDTPTITEDDVPEPPVDPITQPGDLWLLGEHRLLCGDSTKAEDVARLMDGKKADAVWTDPPYGVNHIGGTKDPRRASHRTGGVVHNDEKMGDDLVRLVSDAVGAIPKANKAVCYMASPAGSNVREMIDAFNASGFVFKHTLVWVKSAFVFGRADYHYKHELVLYGWGDSHEWSGPRNISTVFEFPRGDKSIEHPTSKPVGLITSTLSNHPGDLVVDPFLGSGTTLIAAEQLGRTCYGMEISSQYCDVIVKRWETLTGKQAVRVSSES